MRKPLNSKRSLHVGAILVIMVCLVCLTCNFAPLLYNVNQLDIPTPPGSIVTTSRYRTAPFPFGDLAWDRHYRIPTSTFASLDAVQQYFDTWITDHAWEAYDRGPCNSARGVTFEEVDARVTEDFVPADWAWPNSPPEICLMIMPKPQQGYYDVRLVTFQPGLFESIDD
jgi:hypothetical protein